MKPGRLVKLLSAFLIMALFTAGCGPLGKTANKSNGKLTIVATLFPQYDFVKAIAQDKAEVVLLLPPGMEAHAYEPTPQDIVTIQKSDMFIYTGEAMEPWAHRVIEGVKGKAVKVIDVSSGIELLNASEEDHDEEEEDHHHGGVDPHIWTDPVNAEKMVDTISEGLSSVDPKNSEFYSKNAEQYKAELQALDQKFKDMFAKTKSQTIIYAGHFALGYFAKRYSLTFISPYNGFAPDAEPTPQKIAELIKNIKATGINVIYYEELIDPKIARVISNETGAKIELLHGGHNVSRAELESGITYMKLMESNLEKLKEGLGYHE